MTSGKPIYVGNNPTYVPDQATYGTSGTSSTSYPTTSFYDYFTKFFPALDFSLSSNLDASISQGGAGTGGGYGKPVEEVGYGEVEEEVPYGYARPEPSKTELLVLRYPDIIKTFAQGISAVSLHIYIS